MIYAAASTDDAINGPEVAVFIAFMFAIIFVIGIASSMFLELRKTRALAGQEDALRQLVNRYEQLAENSLDAQKRIAVDLSELRTRTAAIEQILRTVE
jgi:hypothetical protein